MSEDLDDIEIDSIGDFDEENNKKDNRLFKDVFSSKLNPRLYDLKKTEKIVDTAKDDYDEEFDLSFDPDMLELDEEDNEEANDYE